MRPATIRRVLAGQLGLSYPPDRFWHSCFQRPYSRSVLSKDIVLTTLRPTHPPLRQESLPFLARIESFPQRHGYPYTSATTTDTSLLPKIKDMQSLPRASHCSKVLEATAGSSERPRNTNFLLTALARVLQHHDLKLSLELYLMLRHRFMKPIQARRFFQCECKLVQLFHLTRIELESRHPREVKQITLSNRRRGRVLIGMGRRITRNPDQVIAIARLLNAIEKGKAMVQYSYQSRSAKNLQDWREALKVLETWAPADLPSSPESESTTTQEGNEHDAPSSTLQSPSLLQPPQAFKVTDELLRQELSTWLTSLMKRLVYSHTNKIRTMLDTIPQRFGIETTVEMYLVLMDYYSMLGRDGRKDIFALIIKMNNENVKWKHEHAVYHHLLNSLSQMSGNEVEAEKIIDHMLASSLVPKEDTMRAAIMCAARSGDLETCSRYIHKMHQEWNLTISERMKAILLYACAVRGDFDSALEILTQLNQAKTGRRVNPKDSNSRIALKSTPRTSPSTFTDIEGTLSTQDVIDNSNILLALINQTHARRGHKKRISQEFLKDEVHKVLQLFTIITKDPNQVDTQLYSIMMQYLSTLPSPLPGMMYLYKEMCMLENAQPNGITYRIMLDACAEQMDMDQAKQLWSDMDANHIPKSSLIRASYVKGWGRTGDLETAERIAREGILEQERLEHDLLWRQSEPVVRSKERQDPLSALLNPRRLQRQRQATKMIGSGVLHELMTAHKVHDQPGRVYELYREMEAGNWGVGISPNENSLAIVLEACGLSSATAKLVDQSIDLVEQFLEKQRYRHLQLQGNGDMDLKKGQHSGSHEANSHRDEPFSEDRGLFDSETLPGMHLPMALSDANYRLYYIMLGRHHRQRKMVEVWDDMMQWIKRPPSRLTFKVVTEALENVQWGAAPIKRIRRQLEERWPDVGWTSTAGGGRRGSYDPSDEDESVGAGGRFWR